MPAHGADAPWSERDASDRHATLTGILAQVSMEALQGDTLDAVLQGIVDCLARQLPVAIASIILLNNEATHFTQEVSAGTLALDLPADLPWPVSVGVSGRCVRSGEAQLIVDVEADPDYVSGNPQVRSEYLVPIRHHHRLHGILNLESTRADFFNPQVCAAFDAVALQVAGAIHLARVVGELEQANRRLEQLSMSDGLTGIANRRSFDRHLAQEWAKHAQQRKPLALLLVDVDCFKALNDACGHVHGDRCLRELAALCTDVAREDGALVARYGGEEFVLLLPHGDLAKAGALGERLRVRVESMATPHPASPVASHVTVSIGVSSVFPRETGAPESLIVSADCALYAAKSSGRNRVVVV